MGRAIYGTPISAIRELLQNAVDACTYKDSLQQSYDKSSVPSRGGRIRVRYQETEPNKDVILSCCRFE